MDETRDQFEQAKQEADSLFANLPFLFKIKDLSERTNIPDRTIYSWAKEGEFGYYLFRGMIMIDVREFNDYLRKHYQPPRPKLASLRPRRPELTESDENSTDESH